MARYNQFYYNTALYGLQSPLGFSAEPMSASAIDYGRVVVTYASPTGTYESFRIVRNQEAYPLSQEDGFTVLSTTDGVHPPGGYVMDDQTSEVPLVGGRFVYYRAWLRKGTSTDWIPVGSTYTVVPKSNTLTLPVDTTYTKMVTPSEDGFVNNLGDLTLSMNTTHERFLSLLPRVLTSTTNSPLDEPEPVYSHSSGQDYSGIKSNSLISTFLSGFSYTVDEFLTMAELIQPDNPGHGASPSVVSLRSYELGLTEDVDSVTVAQKKLLRNAVNIYQTKGTVNGITTYIKSITDFDAEVTDLQTYNLLLSHEDATFDISGWNTGDALGRWAVSSGSPTLSVVTNAQPPALAYSLDKQGSYGLHSAKIVTGGTTSAISLGANSPITEGIPVTPSTAYSLGFYTKAGSAVDITPSIKWFDRGGVLISTSTSSAITLSTSWAQKKYENVTSPSTAYYAVISLSFAADETYHLDSVQFNEGATVDATYYEPRGVYINLLPTKTNLVQNPNFESASAGAPTYWTGSGGTLTQSNDTNYTGGSAETSGFSGKIVASGNASMSVTAYNYYSDVIANEAYSASVWASWGTSGSGKKVTAQIKFYTSSNTLISTASGSETVVTGSWGRVTVTATAPSNAAKAKVSFVTDSTTVTGNILYLDAAQLERSAVVTDYFDGTATIFRDTYWSGAVGTVSYYYLGGSNKIARLQKEVTEYLPYDTPYYIEFGGSANYPLALSGIA